MQAWAWQWFAYKSKYMPIKASSQHIKSYRRALEPSHRCERLVCAVVLWQGHFHATFHCGKHNENEFLSNKGNVMTIEKAMSPCRASWEHTAMSTCMNSTTCFRKWLEDLRTPKKLIYQEMTQLQFILTLVMRQLQLRELKHSSKLIHQEMTQLQFRPALR